MTEKMAKLKQRLVVARKGDGRCCYDPQAKQELIKAGLQPGISVAKLAPAHGINANLLRTWMTKHQRQSLVDGSARPSAAAPAPFIRVMPISAHRSLGTPPALAARLHNGVRLEWSALPVDQLAQVLQVLSTQPYSDSIPG